MPHASHPSPRFRIVRATELSWQPWRNGAGSTQEIARSPAGEGDGWDWRLSIARIGAPAPFSAFPGIEREQVLLHGAGVRLHFADDGSLHALQPPHGRLRFAGGRALLGEPVDGPAEVFNLMWRPKVCEAQLWLRPLVGTMAVFVDPQETWALHLIAGQARFMDDSPLGELGAGDTAILPGQHARRRYVLDGGGELLLIRLVERERRQ